MSKRRQVVMSVPLLALFWTQARRAWAQPAAEPARHMDCVMSPDVSDAGGPVDLAVAGVADAEHRAMRAPRAAAPSR